MAAETQVQILVRAILFFLFSMATKEINYFSAKKIVSLICFFPYIQAGTCVDRKLSTLL